MNPIRNQSRTDNLILLLLACLFFSIGVKRHSDHFSTVFNSSDTKGYYIYLPEIFIYHTTHLPGTYDFGGRHLNDHGESFTKYTCGVAFCYLPFFLVGHAYAHMFHADVSGFGVSYSIAIILCCVVWAFIGLYVLKKILLQFFSRGVVWVTLLCIMLGTNFYNYATHEVGMSHIYSFSLFSILILVTDRYYKSPTLGRAVLIGMLYGWIVLIRPTNALLLIFLVLYNINTAATLKERMTFLYKRIPHMLLALPFFLVLFVPQLFYWKEMTGHWIKYSYIGEGFPYLLRPKIARVLFDTQNGLFTWAPILLFFLWALFMRKKDPRTNAWGVSIVFVITTYIFASWCAWWFGGAYGHRCYIEYFPLLAFPLAVTAERVLAIKKHAILAAFGFVVLLFFYCNIRLTHVYMSSGYGVFDGHEWEWNWDALISLIRKIFSCK